MPKNLMIKIMCIGDSITFGKGMPGSYRKFLYNNLVIDNYFEQAKLSWKKNFSFFKQLIN